MENVEHHIEEEEGEMFPMASERLGDTLDSLGAKMEERKQELQTSGQVGGGPSSLSERTRFCTV